MLNAVRVAAVSGQQDKIRMNDGTGTQIETVDIRIVILIVIIVETNGHLGVDKQFNSIESTILD